VVTSRSSPWLLMRYAVPCRSIPLHRSRFYTVLMTANAPTRVVRTVSRSVPIPSCSRGLS
jgi:hypothetical protein